ncbi:hypothetical protein M422DRAFT_273499 [Sphaerobolus stellatus SS14]|uniref:Uncharacterized protein n=1 Tax=Sphaerobolus stellatus (strain SS14) TaxID=990650 RepID=A0A0C9UJW2_SPHS4|nr:hypothetical protein M422DRAFT_273499 [Sphaerobolus stellatus SS14]
MGDAIDESSPCTTCLQVWNLSTLVVPPSLRKESKPNLQKFNEEAVPQLYMKKYQKFVDVFLLALKEMSNLRLFYWTPRAENANMYFSDLVHDTLAHHCPNLCQVQSFSEEPCHGQSTTCHAGLHCDYYIRQQPDHPFKNLTNINLILRGRHGNGVTPFFFNALTLINPDLQCLHLEWISALDDDLVTGTPERSVVLLHSQWPHLVRLSVKGRICLYTDNMETGQKAKLLDSLLARHPKLKCLRLGSAVRILEQSIEQP